MLQRLKQMVVSLTAGIALLVIMVGLPVGLVAAVGWPLPTTFPGVGGFATAIEQRNIAAEVVINTLAVVVWVLWAQLLWALVWELVVNGRRLAQGLRSRPAPLVAAPLNALAVRLVSGLLAASVVATTAATSLSLPTAPTLAMATGDLTGTGVVDANDPTGPSLDHLATDRAWPSRSLEAGVLGSAAGGGPKWLVKDGDSLWSIAETTFGDGERSAEVLTLNPNLASARSVRPGVVLLMPLGAAVPQDRIPTTEAADEMASANRGHLPATEIEVERGDNLWDLSEHRLERVIADPGPGAVADHVAEVVEANTAEIDDPDLIHPGQVLAFPSIGEGRAPDTGLIEDGDPPADPEGGATRQPPEANDAQPRPSGHGPVGESAEEAPGKTSDRDLQNRASQDGDSQGRDQAPVGAPLVLGVAGAFLAAGVLDLVCRRWRFRMSHRSSGRVPRAPDPALRSIEQALIREADEETRRWVDGAIGSLTLRPVWEGEKLAQPAIVRVGPNSLEVEFDAADPMAAPVPWSTDDDGRQWRLDRSIPLDELGPSPAGTPLPTLVTVGADLMVNLEAMGVLGIEGPGTDPMALVRSIVHELATSPAAGAIDIRSTVPIIGVGAYEMVRLQSPTELDVELPSWLADVESELASTSSSTAYGHRLVTDLDPIGPVVVVSDEAGCRSMSKVMDYARKRSLPLAVVVVGPVGSTGAENVIVLGQTMARLEPAAVEFEPQLLSAERARELGRLLDDVATEGEEPLVTSVELSASVTDIRRSSGRKGPIEPPVRPTSLDPEPSAVTASPDLAENALAGSVEASVEAIVGAAGSASEVDAAEHQITIQVLGDVRAKGASEEMTSQQLSLVCYLACNGSSSRDALIEALWDGQVISKSRFPNLLAETRARIGRHHFPEARDGRYELRAVTTDLAQFERSVLIANREDADSAVATLREAIELVRGVPFTPPGRRFWSWVGEHSHVAARVESMVADTAARLARMEQARGSTEGARLACEKGLLASPTDETLVVVLTEIYMELGRPGLARRLVDSWEDRVSQMDCGEPSDEPRKRLAG